MAHNLTEKSVLLDSKQMARVIRRMAGELLERDRGISNLVLVGIQTRGVPLAKALAAEIKKMEGIEVPLGAIDITLYRDDLSTIAAQPVVKGTTLPVAIDGTLVVLCDDVLYTGRTVRAAIDHLLDYGRPRAVQLAVLIDRGHRELPIQADVVGKKVPTSSSEVIEVTFHETDATEQVRLLDRGSAQPPSSPTSPLKG